MWRSVFWLYKTLYTECRFNKKSLLRSYFQHFCWVKRKLKIPQHSWRLDLVEFPESQAALDSLWLSHRWYETRIQADIGFDLNYNDDTTYTIRNDENIVRILTNRGKFRGSTNICDGDWEDNFLVLFLDRKPLFALLHMCLPTILLVYCIIRWYNI